jgi:hypothetical protein
LLIAAGADVIAVSHRLGHTNPCITLGIYSHAFQRRDAAPLGERLAAFIRQETLRCDSVAAGTFCEVPARKSLKRLWPRAESNHRHADFQ